VLAYVSNKSSNMASGRVELAFATLTPTNVLARMAFGDLYSRLIAGR
jgi:hypothetical protein